MIRNTSKVLSKTSFDFNNNNVLPINSKYEVVQNSVLKKCDVCFNVTAIFLNNY